MVSELVSLMFTQDDAVPLSDTGSTSGQESDQDRPSAGDDIDRERDTTSTSRRGLPEVMIHCTQRPINATFIAAPVFPPFLPPSPPLSVSDSEEPGQHFRPDSTETV